MSTAANNSAAKPRTPLRPGAKTKVLAAAGDRPYDKTFDDLRFEMTVGEPFQAVDAHEADRSDGGAEDSHSRLYFADAAAGGHHAVCAGARQPGVLLRSWRGALRLHSGGHEKGEDGRVLDSAGGGGGDFRRAGVRHRRASTWRFTTWMRRRSAGAERRSAKYRAQLPSLLVAGEAELVAPAAFGLALGGGAAAASRILVSSIRGRT